MVDKLGAVASNLFTRGAFPHTGTQMIIFAAVVVALLVVGIVLWFYSHPRKLQESQPSGQQGGVEDQEPRA